MIRRQTSQEQDILELIKVQPTCIIRNQYLDNISQVSINTVNEILEQTFMNSIDMNAILCLFSTFLQSSKKKNSIEEPYILDIKSTSWLKKMEIIDVSSVFGTAYKSSIIHENSNINVILKVTKNNISEKQLYREYILGVNALNKLRYYVPTLAYVLGIFKCFNPFANVKDPSGTLCAFSRGRNKRTPYIIYERADGPAVSSIIRNFKENETYKNFKKFLEIFVQILITLEISQKECSFTHYDLHTSNIMTKEKPLQYNVSIDNSTYTITTTTLPVIIDYGNSSAKINNKVYGLQGLTFVGIMKHMIPGFDMYRFLVSALSILENHQEKHKWKITNNVRDLFKFYGQDDYYDIVQKRSSKTAADEYCGKVSTTKLATYTPKMFLDWILNNNHYAELLKDIVRIDVRNVYMPIHPSILTNKYNKIFENIDQNKTEAINIINSCSKLSPSYLMNKYTVYVLTKYNTKSDLNDNQILQRINFIEEITEEPVRKQQMIDVDMNFLRGYVNITAPTKYLCLNNRLVPLPQNNIIELTRRVECLVQFKEKIKQYLQYFYTLREIGYENSDPYMTWIQEFTNGNSYITYVENITEIERVIRWKEVLTQAQ